MTGHCCKKCLRNLSFILLKGKINQEEKNLENQQRNIRREFRNFHEGRSGKKFSDPMDKSHLFNCQKLLFTNIHYL